VCDHHMMTCCIEVLLCVHCGCRIVVFVLEFVGKLSVVYQVTGVVPSQIEMCKLKITSPNNIILIQSPHFVLTCQATPSEHSNVHMLPISTRAGALQYNVIWKALHS